MKKAPARAAGQSAESQTQAADVAPTGRKARGRKSAADRTPSTLTSGSAGGDADATSAAEGKSAKGAKPPRGARKGRKRGPRFETGEAEPGKKRKRARLEKMRRAGAFGVPGRPRRLKRRKTRDEMVRPSPPLEKTDPMKHYLSGDMVPCPVGCGGFSEVVRISTMENGAGEVWFECLSCAQRKMFVIAPATMEERTKIAADLEGGHEPFCPRHSKQVQLRRRGRDFACPECGVSFPEP